MREENSSKSKRDFLKVNNEKIMLNFKSSKDAG